MLQDFYKDFSKNSKKLIDDGFFIIDIENIEKLGKIRNSFTGYLKESHGIEIVPEKLELLHEHISIESLNDIRLGFFQFINSTRKEFTLDYLDLARHSMFEVVGTELASSKMVNFSIQFPNDESSILPIHSDMFSGESPFQINLWIPLTDAKDTNSMFIFNPIFSQKICNKLGNYEEVGLDSLMSENKNEYHFLDVPFGKALIFSSACLHGNVVNQTKRSRLSFNCRYKNLFTPYNQSKESEKKLGSFYKPLSPKAATLIGLNFNLDE
jgi:sporadic carbohydrate cluster 2OG-Fe(II) oxygenase